MITDIEWRNIDGKWVLYAYNDHVWFPVPYVEYEEDAE